MAKLLALFALTIVTFAHVSISTKPDLPDEPCSSPVTSQQLTHCLKHLNEHTSIQLDIYKLRIMAVKKQPEQQHLQQCCKQLSLVQQQCQCDAIQKVFDQARKEGGREVVVEKLVVKAARLPDDCGLRVKQCPIVTPRDDYKYMVV